MPPDSIDTSQEQSQLAANFCAQESLTSLDRKSDLELPSFAPFIEYKRYDDAIGLDSEGNKTALHKCILAAKTNFFDLDNNDILDLKGILSLTNFRPHRSVNPYRVYNSPFRPKRDR